MAIDAYMQVTGNYSAGASELNDGSQFEIFRNMVQAQKQMLNAAEFTRISSALANDPSITSPMTLGDMIRTVVQEQQNLVAQVQNSMKMAGSFSPTVVDQVVQNNMGQSVAMTKANYLVRVPPMAAADGPTLYADNCAVCHGAIDVSTKAGKTAADIQAAIDSNTGGMGAFSNMTSTEIQAIADALAAAAPTSPPATVDGLTLYSNNCAVCHGSIDVTTKAGRTAADIQAAITNNTGGMGTLSSLTAAEIQAIADVLPAAPPSNPSTPPDGVALYNSECSGCHGTLDVTSKAGKTAADIQTAIANNIGGMGALSTLTANEIQAIADALPAAPTTPGTPAPLDGATLYANNCASCHGALNVTTKAGRTAADIQNAIGNIGTMAFLSTLSADEIQAIADALPAAPTTPGTPAPLDGATLYANNCASCHGALNVTTKAGRTAADIQNAIGNIGTMGFLSTLSADEIQAIADVLPAAPTTPGTPAPLDGATLYANNCASCHGALNVTTKAGRTAADIQNAIGNIATMAFLSTLSVDEIQAIADVLPAATGGTPDYSDCTACHGQPPSGNTFPDTAGAHAVHVVLPSINNNCAVCHSGAAHNSQVDVAIQANFDAKSGAAVYNGDGTCSNVSCHGGQTTPVWWSGTISVDTQCTACHASGTSQYNSYYSGHHSTHLRQGFACTVCHNTGTLQNGHFSNLATPAFEQSPASTIGGGGTTRVGSYVNGTCSSVACHGSQHW